MTNNFNSQEEEHINLQKYIFLFLANWYWFALALIFALGVVYLINRYTTPIYEVKNTILIAEKEDAMGAMSSIMRDLGSVGGKSQNIENYLGILQSYTLTKSTLEQLNYRVSYKHKGRVNHINVYNKCPIRINLDTSFAQKEYENIFVTILSNTHYKLEIPRDSNAVSEVLKYNELFISDENVFTVSKTDFFSPDIIGETYIARINNYNRLTKQYLRNLSAEASFRKGTIVELTARGVVPEQVVEFLNTLILVAIERDLEEKNRTSHKTIEFIDNQLLNIVDSLNYAEQNLETFRSDNKIIDLSIEGSALFKRIEELQTKRSLIDMRISYYEYILQTIKERSDLHDIVTPSVIGVQDPSLNALISQLNQLYAEEQVIKFSATPNNPSLKLNRIRIESTISAIQENVTNLITSARIEARAINNEIAVVDKNIQKLPKTERELININRRFELNDNIYNFLLQKRAEVGITKAANLPDLKFIDMAYIDNIEQKAPRKKLNILIALFLAFAFPGAVIIIRDFFNNKIVEREEIEQKCSIPILGSIAHNRREDSSIPVKKHPKSSIAESFRTIRTNLVFFLKYIKRDTPIITFTSTISGEGKTFCAINLATMIAMNNKRVLVVGLDMRKPRLHEVISSNFSLGISNYLIGKNTIEEITIKSVDENLDVILSGPTPPNPLELIESKEFESFIDEITKLSYDVIIFDTPPIGLVADTLAISRFADLNIFVVRQNYTNKNALKFINDIHQENKIKNLSLLINDVDMLNSYGYRYGAYGQKYGYGYYDDEHLIERNVIKRCINRVLNRK